MKLFKRFLSVFLCVLFLAPMVITTGLPSNAATYSSGSTVQADGGWTSTWKVYHNGATNINVDTLTTGGSIIVHDPNGTDGTANAYFSVGLTSSYKVTDHQQRRFSFSLQNWKGNDYIYLAFTDVAPTVCPERQSFEEDYLSTAKRTAGYNSVIPYTNADRHGVSVSIRTDASGYITRMCVYVKLKDGSTYIYAKEGISSLDNAPRLDIDGGENIIWFNGSNELRLKNKHHTGSSGRNLDFSMNLDRYDPFFANTYHGDGYLGHYDGNLYAYLYPNTAYEFNGTYKAVGGGNPFYYAQSTGWVVGGTTWSGGAYNSIWADLTSLTPLDGTPSTALGFLSYSNKCYASIGIGNGTSGRRAEFTLSTVQNGSGATAIPAINFGKNFTATFDAGSGGTIDGTSPAAQTTTQSYYYGQSYGTFPTASKPGFTATSWQYNGVTVNPSGNYYALLKDATLTPVWVPSVTNYTVTYVGTPTATYGLNSNPASQTVSSGTSITLPTPTPASGYGNFYGWTTESDVSKIRAGDFTLLTGSYTVTGNVTLYPVVGWKVELQTGPECSSAANTLKKTLYKFKDIALTLPHPTGTMAGTEFSLTATDKGTGTYSESQLSAIGITPGTGFNSQGANRSFMEWNTAYDGTSHRGSGTSYWDTYTANATATLYAMFGYPIIFDAMDGGHFEAGGSTILGGSRYYETYVADYSGMNGNGATQAERDHSSYYYIIPDGNAVTSQYGVITPVNGSNVLTLNWVNSNQTKRGTYFLTFNGGSTTGETQYNWTTVYYPTEWNTYKVVTKRNAHGQNAAILGAAWDVGVTFDKNGGGGANVTRYLNVDYSIYNTGGYNYNKRNYTQFILAPSSDGTDPVGYGTDLPTAADLSFTAPTGKVFNGWNTAPDGSGTSYPAGYDFASNYHDIASVTLYAQWRTPVTVTATLDPVAIDNGLTFFQTFVDTERTSAGRVEDTTYNSAFSSFVHYYSIIWDDGDTYNMGDSGYQHTFSGQDSVTVSDGADTRVKIQFNNPEIGYYYWAATDWYLTYWSTTHNSSVSFGSSGTTSATFNSNTTLYPTAYRPYPYNMSFDASKGYIWDGSSIGTLQDIADATISGGAGITGNGDYSNGWINTGRTQAGKVVTFSNIHFNYRYIDQISSFPTATKTGYHIKYWYWTDGVKTYHFDPGADHDAERYAIHEDATLYPVWEIDTYTIEYKRNGGTGSIADGTKTHGVNFTLSNGSGFTGPAVTLTFNGNGGTPSVATATGTRAITGWKTAANSGTSYALGGVYSTDAAATMYAQWGAVTINFSDDETYYASRDGGYVFAGWFTAADGGTEITSYTFAAANAAGSYTVYAHWTSAAVSLTFDSNNSTANNETVTGMPSNAANFPYDTATAISLAVPTMELYEFVEWNTASDGSGTGYDPGDPLTTTANVTLYAIWRPILRIDGASLKLDAGVNIVFYVKTGRFSPSAFNTSGASLTMNFITQNGKSTADRTPVTSFAETETIGGVTYYKFIFRDLNPSHFGETITATISAPRRTGSDTVTPHTHAKTYSIAEYCANIIKGDYTAKEKRLAASILYYGEASEPYARVTHGYSTPTAVMSRATAVALGKDVASVSASEISTYKSGTLSALYSAIPDRTPVPVRNASPGTTASTFRWKGVALYLQDKIWLKISFIYTGENKDDLRVVANGVTYTVGGANPIHEQDAERGIYYIMYDRITPDHFETVVSSTVYENDTVLSRTLNYNIDGYLDNIDTTNKPELADLVAALVKYGSAATDYMA